METYVVTAHYNRLDETVLMMAHNIGFKGVTSIMKTYPLIIPITLSYLDH